MELIPAALSLTVYLATLVVFESVVCLEKRHSKEEGFYSYLNIP